MPKYLITGRQGSGKTSIIHELSKRGFTAYNTDDLPKDTKLQNISTGEAIDWPDGKVDWEKYAWNWQKNELKGLLASDKVVFIGAVVSNQKDYYSLFDEIFVVSICEETLRKRLGTHQHASHHLPGVIDRIANNHQQKQQVFIEDGATPIDGEPSTEIIVDGLLQRLGLTKTD